MLSSTIYYELTLLPLVPGLPALTFSTLRMVDDFGPGGRVWNWRSFRGSLYHLVSALVIIGSVFFQAEFAPVSPHLGSNLYRSFSETLLMVLLMAISIMDHYQPLRVRREYLRKQAQQRDVVLRDPEPGEKPDIRKWPPES